MCFPKSLLRLVCYLAIIFSLTEIDLASDLSFILSGSEEVTSVEVNVVLEHIVYEVVAVIVAFIVVDGPVVSISIQGIDQFWPIQGFYELVTAGYIYKARRQSQFGTLSIKNINS